MGKELDRHKDLPWNFEAFRLFLRFEVMQQAASAICLFDGQEIFNDPAKMEQFQSTMANRTGMDWAPQRTVSEEVLFDVEGNLFRNKARVLTSMFLLDPDSLKKKGNNPINSVWESAWDWICV